MGHDEGQIGVPVPPQKDDQPFKKGKEGPTLAQLDWQVQFKSEDTIAIAFREAADRIVESMMTEDPFGYRDILFYPITYLYRHALELYLKWTVRKGLAKGILKAEKTVDKTLGEHNLQDLWKLARRSIDKVCAGEDREALEAVQRRVFEFHRLDPSGQELRYPRSKEGEPYLVGGPAWVDLANLKEVMTRVFGFLDGTGSALIELPSREP